MLAYFKGPFVGVGMEARTEMRRKWIPAVTALSWADK